MVGTRRSSGQNSKNGLVSISNSAQMKFRPMMETGRSTAKGTKLLPQPVTISEVLTKFVIHFCKRILYTDIKVRLLVYAIILFFVSLVTDYVPLPKSYFSNTQNVFNQAFVKFSWGWTLSFVAIFLSLTTSVYCCGNKKQICRHFLRLLMATFIWYTWTTLFTALEETTGKCLYLPPGSNTGEIIFSKGRRSCLKNRGKWTSFDISGHSFLLIWCVLFIIEESKPIICWDLIGDYIRDEGHKRSNSSSSSSSSSVDLTSSPETPLSSLTSEEFDTVKTLYSRHSLWAKLCLIILTFLVLIWDLMLFMTACYFHIMIEKVLGGLIAITMWKLTYGWFYQMNISVSPGLPGHGRFKYSSVSYKTSLPAVATKGGTNINNTKLKSKESEELPSFMGMPLYALRNKNKGSGGGGSSTGTVT